MANRTGKGWFVKGRRSANPAGRPKNPVIPPPPPGYAPEPAAADRRPIRNLVIEARKFSGLAVDTLVELTKITRRFDALQRRDGPARPRLWSPGAILGSASFSRRDHETA